jgi:Mechanosensitive ion channel, conserved TM helix
MRSLFDRMLIDPFNRLADQSAHVVPILIMVLVTLIIGGFLAFVARMLTYKLLQLARFDRLVQRTGFSSMIERTGVFRSPSDLGARFVQALVWLFVILFALTAAGTPASAGLVMRFVDYIPNMIAAGLVLLLGVVVSRMIARSALLAAVNAQWPAARLIAGGVRVLVMTLAIVIALEQLHIGSLPLLVAFAIVFAGIVFALAIAFGLGARDMARQWLEAKVRHSVAEEEVFRHL